MEVLPMDAKTAVRLAVLAVAVFGVSVVVGILIARSNRQPALTQASTTTAVVVDSTAPTTTATTILSAAPQAISETSTTTIAPARDFADLFEEVRGAIASVDVVRCASNARGSSFLVDSETAYTAWNVVENSAEIALDFGEQRVEAMVIGRDVVRNVAVLRLAAPLDGAEVVRIAPEQVRIGEQIAAVGHPQDQPLAMTVGRVTSTDGRVAIDSEGRRVVQGALQTDSPSASGLAGGPLINERGEVVGVVVETQFLDSGFGYGADIDGVRDALLGWTLNPEPVRPSFCIGEIDLNDIDQVAPELIRSEVDASEVLALQRTFAVYTQSINSGRAEEAFAVLGPAQTAATTAEQWAQGQETSKLWDWNIRSIELTENGLNVRSTVRSTQEEQFSFDGQSECTRWDLIHNMVLGDFQGREFWLINGLAPGPGGLAVDCAQWEPTRVQRGRIDAPPVGEELVIEDFLAAGTIDAWTLRGSIPQVGATQTYSVTVETTGDQNRLGLTVVGGGDAGTSAQVVFERDGRIELEVAEFVGELGGNYRLTITNVSPPQADPPQPSVPVDGAPTADADTNAGNAGNDGGDLAQAGQAVAG